MDDWTAWAMCRAWELLMRIPGFDIARTHKVLHHKRPKQFPLLDNRTAAHLRNRCAGEPESPLWDMVLQDLHRNGGAFGQLEDRFAKAISGHRQSEKLVPLFRLRMHDILIWCDSRESSRDETMKVGREWIESHRPSK
jgi:hypothetical protein